MKRKVNIAAGQKVKGWGVMNQYGEFEFIPEETGKYAGRTSVIFQTDGMSVKETTRHFLISLKVEKRNTWTQTITKIYEKLTTAVQRLRDYEV